MAARIENLGTFEIERLRTTGTTYPSGAINEIGSEPEPIARAFGPEGILVGGTVTAGETWALGVAVPAVSEVVWVVVRANVMIFGVTASAPVLMSIFTQGDTADLDNTEGPVFIDPSPRQLVPGTAGSFSSVTSMEGATGLFVPIDPAATSAGFFMVCHTTAGSTGPTVGQWSANLRNVILLGYPVNYWKTGKLWQNTLRRGS